MIAEQCSAAAYYGKLIGKLSQLHHGVSGEVYAVDARTLFIKDFTYDGEGPGWYSRTSNYIYVQLLRSLLTHVYTAFVCALFVRAFV